MSPKFKIPQISLSPDNRRKWGIRAVIVLAVFLLLYNSVILITPGYVGVFVKRNGGGVSQTPLGVGFHMKMPILHEVVEYPIYMQTLILTKSAREGSPYNDEINVNSVEGQPISCDVSLSFELDPAKVPDLYTSFRTDIQTIMHGFVKQTIRQSMQETIGRSEIVNFLGKDKAKIVAQTQEDLQRRLGGYGFIVKQFTLNEVRAPESIIRAIEAKNAMAQDALRSQNELQKREFEAQQKIVAAEANAKAILTEAKAQAESNKLLSESLTPALVEYRRIEKWNGQLPQVSGGATPFITMNK